MARNKRRKWRFSWKSHFRFPYRDTTYFGLRSRVCVHASSLAPFGSSVGYNFRIEPYYTTYQSTYVGSFVRPSLV